MARMWEIREDYSPREHSSYGDRYMGERDSEAKRAYDMGYNDGCEDGYRKAMREKESMGERYGSRYGERDEMGERRDSRGRYM